MPPVNYGHTNNHSNAASHSSCQTVHHANLMPATNNNNGNINDNKQELSSKSKDGSSSRSGSKMGMGASSHHHSSKKKSTPLKRPVSAIGDRHVTPPINSRVKKGGDSSSLVNHSHSNNGGGGGLAKKSRKQSKMTAEESGSVIKSSSALGEGTKSAVESSRDALSSHSYPKQSSSTPTASSATASTSTPTASSANAAAPDQSSRSESRDTLYYHFGNTAPNSNQGTSNSVSSRGLQLSSPPALQSKPTSQKEKMGNQRTLNSFFGIAGEGGKKKGDKGKDGKEGEDKEGGKSAKDGMTNNEGVATSTASSAKSASSAAKKNKSSLKPSSTSTTPNAADILAHSTQSHSEIKRLHAQISTLQSQLEDANARNNSIRNTQTLLATNLQRQLKFQTNELQQVKKEHSSKMTKALNVVERLVKEEAVRESKELRQKLASDGARLGRLVSSRVAGGTLGGMRSQLLESWEDGHAPRILKVRRGELRRRREGLERRREELLRGSVSNESGLQLNNESSLQISSDTSNAANDATLPMNDLDRIEANETVRMHLDELRRKEMELDSEERALNIEKRAHVRALKLVSNEDSSKFRVRRKLHDRYLLMNLLGKGGFSEVWRAFDLQSLSHVAVKIHQLESSWSDAKKENYTKHVSREYEIHREVRHPRIVSLFDVFEIDTDSFATVLECCKGTDLDTMLKDRGRLPERDARAILMQILSGMRYLSSPSADGRRQGIIHYDLKPGNILFDENGNAKITDFGLSKIVDAGEDGGDSMELTSQGAGTYWYLPPECFLMDQDVRISNKVDVWSIGVIYYQMLFGRRPFGDGQSQDHILRNQTMLHATEVHFPSKPTITEEGKAFIRDCLTYDQMSRPNMSQICEHGYLKLTAL